MTTSENNNGNNTLLIALILSLLFTIFLTSCGSRKVTKSETKEQEQTEVKTTIATETKIVDNTKIVDTSVTDEIEFIPIDSTKEIIVNGKKYFNVKIKHKKTKNNISVAKDVKVQHNAQKSDLKTVKTNKRFIEKEIERKQSYWWLLSFLLLIPIYYLYKKYKL